MKNTGWAVLFPEGKLAPDTGLYQRPSWPGDETQELLMVEELVTDLIIKYQVTDVFFEGIVNSHHDDDRETFIANAIPSHIMTAAGRLNVKARVIKINVWRSTAYGTDKAPPGLQTKSARTDYWKNLAVSTCMKMGWMIENHNRAEAALIAHAGRRSIDNAYAAKTDALVSRRQVEYDIGRFRGSWGG